MTGSHAVENWDKARTATIDNAAPKLAHLVEEKVQIHKVKEDVLRRWGAGAHAVPAISVDTNGAIWKVKCTDPRDVEEVYIAEKVEAAASYINSFPYFQDEDVFLTAEELERLDTKEQKEQVSIRKAKYQKDMGKGEVPTSVVASYRPEPNRLVDGALTEEDIHSACLVIYSNKDAQFVGCIEATLLAMDLTSEMNGVWRIPLTLVMTRRWDRQVFAHVCVLVVFGGSVALLGRSRLPALGYVRLKKGRTSAIIESMRQALDAHDHDLQTIYMGLPVECPVSRGAGHPVVWRYLKISCEKQAWPSVLATCDLYVSQRKVLWSGSHFVKRLAPKLPPGFAWLLKERGKKMRMKTAAPLLTRAKRARRRRAPEIPDPLDIISASGTWQIQSEEVFLREVHGQQYDDDDSDCSSVSAASLSEFAEDQTLGLLLQRPDGYAEKDEGSKSQGISRKSMSRRSATINADAEMTSPEPPPSSEATGQPGTNAESTANQ
jgi:hypothetical protein